MFEEEDTLGSAGGLGGSRELPPLRETTVSHRNLGHPPPRRPLGSVPRWAQPRFTVSKESPIETKGSP